MPEENPDFEDGPLTDGHEGFHQGASLMAGELWCAALWEANAALGTGYIFEETGRSNAEEPAGPYYRSEDAPLYRPRVRGDREGRGPLTRAPSVPRWVTRGGYPPCPSVQFAGTPRRDQRREGGAGPAQLRSTPPRARRRLERPFASLPETVLRPRAEASERGVVLLQRANPRRSAPSPNRRQPPRNPVVDCAPRA